MISETIRYERLTARRTHTGKCPGCGKSVRRTQTFGMTISPFNRNPDGTQRTRAEVAAAVNAKADQWQPDFTHEACAEQEIA